MIIFTLLILAVAVAIGIFAHSKRPKTEDKYIWVGSGKDPFKQ